MSRQQELTPLVAAAPDMLEALRDIVEQAEQTRLPMGPDLADSIFVLGRAAIVKAEGPRFKTGRSLGVLLSDAHKRQRKGR